eukprot:jgi/Chlat1/8712/Chrsp89S08085
MSGLPSAGESAIKLFRDCLRLADYIGRQTGNREAMREQVVQAFRKNMGETDPLKVIEQKEAAVRGLSNFMVYEAQRLARAHRATHGDNVRGFSEDEDD